VQERRRYVIDQHYRIGLRNQDNVTDADRRVYTSWYDDPDVFRLERVVRVPGNRTRRDQSPFVG